MVAEAFCLFSIRPKAVGLNKRKIPQNHTNLSHQPLLGRLVQRQISMTHQQTSQSQPQKNLKWSQEPEQLGYDTERPQTQGCDIAQLSRLTIAMVENERDKEQHLRDNAIHGHRRRRTGRHLPGYTTTATDMPLNRHSESRGGGAKTSFCGSKCGGSRLAQSKSLSPGTRIGTNNWTASIFTLLPRIP